MKRLLPIFLALFVFAALVLPVSLYAQSPTPTPTSSPPPERSTGSLAEGTWIPDSDVTFAGKLAKRSSYFLESMLANYQWYFISSSASKDSLGSFWIQIRNIVYAFFGIFVLITAFIIIINRGRNMTVMRFIPRFIGIVLLITLSFTLIQFLYQIVDVIQGFFLGSTEATRLLAKDVINVSFKYQDFIGYRLSGVSYDESLFINLLLVKLTSVTMYIMAGILFVRKIILWFFIIISPIFPLLLLYKPIRNSGKIWLGEFLKWLLYAPLFAILLRGVVALWGSGLFANIGSAEEKIYPTATSILLGGPAQILAINNSINGPTTFLLYIFSLIMLWIVMILPFVLLQIFLDYFNNLQPSESNIIKQAISLSSSLFNKPPVAPLPPSLQPAGMARALPIPTKAGIAREIPRSQPVMTTNTISNVMSNPVTTTYNQPVRTTISTQNMSQALTNILKTTNIPVPTMRDIARFDTNTITNTQSAKQESERVHTTLEKIANPRMSANNTEREQFRVIRDQLVAEKQKGSPVASAVLNAATTLSDNKGVAPSIATAITIPAVNRVQQVSLEDYEAVRKLWEDNYAKLETPKGVDGTEKDRKQWVKEDVDQVTEAINKLQSHDSRVVKEGMNMVSSLLPFLLVGGFSQTEILAYLKAKMEAGKSTLSNLDKKQDEESTLLDREEGKKIEEKTMTAEAQTDYTNTKI